MEHTIFQISLFSTFLSLVFLLGSFFLIVVIAKWMDFEINKSNIGKVIMGTFFMWILIMGSGLIAGGMAYQNFKEEKTEKERKEWIKDSIFENRWKSK